MNADPWRPPARPPRSRSLDPRSRATLRTLLEGADRLIPFAEAVVVHLTHGDTSVEARARVIGRIVSVLDVDDDTDDEDRAAVLVADPDLLASVFQNMDLLGPGDPATDALARLVMTALEQMGDVPD